jgi:hypothetical protein
MPLSQQSPESGPPFAAIPHDRAPQLPVFLKWRHLLACDLRVLMPATWKFRATEGRSVTRRRRVELLVILAVGLMGVPGCGGDAASPETESGQPAAGANTDESGDGKNAPANAAEALTAVVEGFQQNRPEAIWEFLPAGHQREINGLAREFAIRMDPELWQQTADVIHNSTGLLKTRKQSILSHPALSESEWAADGVLSQKWDGFAALLATVASGDLADLKQMQTFDGRKFFARFDADSLAQLQDLSILLSDDNPFSMLREMIDGASIRVIEETDDTATVEIRPKNGEPRTFEFARVEGKWLPKSWAEGLLNDVRQAKARFDVELAPGVLAEKKKLVMPYLTDAQDVLDALQNAKTDEAFHAVMTERIIKPALLPGASTGETAPVDLAAKAGDVVHVVVTRQLATAEIDRIADILLGGSDADRELTDDVADGKTVFVISPVKDVAAFAKTITIGKVTQVDLKTRTITVELPEQREGE